MSSFFFLHYTIVHETIKKQYFKYIYIDKGKNAFEFFYIYDI